jgi:hypothetical protein
MDKETLAYSMKSLNKNSRNILKRRHLLMKKIERAENKIGRLEYTKDDSEHRKALVIGRRVLTKIKLEKLDMELRFIDEKLEDISKGLKLLQNHDDDKSSIPLLVGGLIQAPR